MKRGSLAGAAITLVAALGTAGAAAADPAPGNPAGRTAPGGATSVLIVHVEGGARALHAAIAQARGGPGVTVKHTFGALHAFSLRVPASEAATRARQLKSLDDVSSVEQGVVRHFDATPTDDPKLTRQIGYLDAVRAPGAWAKQHGSSAVKIAVVDSGVDVGHPDLVNKIAGTYNAVTGTTKVTDQVGHGTFVAGVAAADTDNRIGVAGAGYATDILAVKIAGPDGAIAVDDEVAGIRWAADHGADIINLSLGGPESSSAEASAIAYARTKGVLVVAAAGNDGDTVKQYPAAYPGVVAVGATNPARGTRAGFSSYGPWVTLAAPGVGVYSTVPRAGSMFWPKSSGYAAGDGTSFSTPMVAGEAALLKAQNPSLSTRRLRTELVESAHGYANRGLGAGQVDFVRGLAHVIPASRPSAVRAIGSARRIRLEATSSAPEVAFKIGSSPTGRPEPVSSGLATSSFASWGYGNGSHTLYAYDCTAYGECSSSPTATTFTVDNSASTIASPAAGTAVTGLFTVRADNPARGPLRLLIGGRERGRVGTAPYEFQVSASALADGSHALTTQGCSIDGRHCSGPVSPPVVITTASLHPAIRSASPSPFSPNGDRVRDTTTLTFALPDTETVQVKVVNSARTTVRSRSLGTLHAGTHVWVWHGRANTGARVADGTYGVVLQTARGNLRGWISRSVVVDTKAPSLTRPSGANALFYPTPDGYRDVFTTHTKLGGPGRLTLAVRNAKRAQVRTIAVQRAAGSATISWQGHRASGGRVPAGTYYWTLSLTDAAGNVRRTGTYPVRVSAKRLVHETVHIGKPGAAYDDAAGTASCAHARRHDSAFLHGVRMVNTCSAQDFDLAFAQYTFTVPRAMSYGQVAIQVYGKSTHVPSELSAAFVANDGTLEIARYLKVGRTGNRWHTISSAPGTNHIAASRHVHATIVLDSYYPGMNDFDIDRARLRVGLVVLK